ncbi:MAG: c-type cytochrome [Rhizomicrobium sp.]|jgi:cytochrome c553
MKYRLAALLAANACLAVTVAFAADNPAVMKAAETKATRTCQDCHGSKGDSVSATYPRLNGQQADYITAQLKNFRDHSRADPHAQAFMWGMASQLDDAIIVELGKYYAGQTPTPPQSGGALAADGKKLYLTGAPAQSVPACVTCHGAHGEGNSIIPRLAGQHADYLKKQLEAFRSTLRDSDIMHANTKDMTDSQIEALVSYLAND